ncbi:MAG: hypothetical protein QXP73_05595 [Candidatus Methanomethylicaceae archaeon]
MSERKLVFPNACPRPGKIEDRPKTPALYQDLQEMRGKKSNVRR